MKVKMLRSLGAGQPPYKESETVDVDDALAEKWIAAGLAEVFREEKDGVKQPTKEEAEKIAVAKSEAEHAARIERDKAKAIAAADAEAKVKKERALADAEAKAKAHK